jgi:hypothetical protein
MKALVRASVLSISAFITLILVRDHGHDIQPEAVKSDGRR